MIAEDEWPVVIDRKYSAESASVCWPGAADGTQQYDTVPARRSRNWLALATAWFTRATSHHRFFASATPGSITGDCRSSSGAVPDDPMGEIRLKSIAVFAEGQGGGSNQYLANGTPALTTRSVRER